MLDAALRLFSRQGYRATTMREIADKAKVSTGNVYHHFPDKEAIFNALLDELWEIADSRRFPFRRALLAGEFPDNLEQLGFAARDSIIEFRQYVALIYVDVIEFDGTHIRKFYGDMARHFAEVLEENGTLAKMQRRMRPGVSAVSAVMLTMRVFFSYFTIEILFNVPEPFGKNSSEVVKDIADVLRNGMI